MIRKIVHFNTEKCNGCGLCARACHENAIGIVNGKAQLLRDDYCDGMGDCLPACPMDAISFEEREALAYDEVAVEQNKQTLSLNLKSSSLKQWPCQIKLAPIRAPFYANSDLLIAASCTAYAYSSFHHDFMENKITLIGCPKLDGVDYSEKLTAIIRNNPFTSITLVKMEVPCCKGLEVAVNKAIEQSKKELPLKVVTISIEGKLI